MSFNNIDSHIDKRTAISRRKDGLFLNAGSKQCKNFKCTGFRLQCTDRIIVNIHIPIMKNVRIYISVKD